MSAGFASLGYLKSQLLAEALRGDESYDAQLTALGRGVAAAFEKICNRKFGRVVGELEIFPADRTEFLLSRFPVEAVTASHVKTNDTDGWVEQAAGFIVITDLKNGIVNTGIEPGAYYAQVQFTTTGGYWVDAASVDRSGTAPAGATALPDDLVLAWVLHCRNVWQAMDKLGTDIVRTGAGANVTQHVGTVAMSNEVREILGKHERYQMT